MKLLKIDKKNNEILVVPQNIDDLWHLEKIIAEGDIVSGKADRKIKPKTEGETAKRETIFVEVRAEGADFHEHAGTLKVNGIIVGGRPEEFVELKTHQSIGVEPGKKLKIKKTALKKWHIERLKKAEKESASSGLLVLLLDDERADLAFVDQFSIKKKATIFSGKQGKQFEEGESKYFEEVYNKILNLDAKKVLVAGPGFERENFQKYAKEKKNPKFPKMLSTTTSEIGETGFRELLRSGKLDALEKELQLSEESKTIEEFMKNIRKGLAEYGKEEVEKAIGIGAVETLILGEEFLLKNREDAEKLLDMAEKTGSKTHIVSSKNPDSEQIMGFGGVVAVLRYKLS